MYCTKCGSYLSDSAVVCPNCNSAVNTKAYANTDNYTAGSNGVYYTPQQEEQSSNYYTQQNNYQPNSQDYYNSNAQNFNYYEIKQKLSGANTLAILAIILGLVFTPIAGVICGAIGLSTINSIPNIPNNNMINAERERIKKLNIIGIVIPVAIWVVLVVIAIIALTIFGFSFAAIMSSVLAYIK